MTVKDLAKLLTKEMKNKDLTAVYNHAQFHNFIATTLEEKLQEILPIASKITSWDIEVFSKGRKENTIIKYDRTFTKDKRCTWSDRGIFSNVTFKAVKGLENIEITRLDKYFTDLERKRIIKYYKNKIKKAEQEVKDTKVSLKDFLKTGV
jgi:hypothetical protein